MTEAEIKAIVNKFAELAEVLRDADPDDKAEVFCQLALKLTYHPRRDYLANGSVAFPVVARCPAVSRSVMIDVAELVGIVFSGLSAASGQFGIHGVQSRGVAITGMRVLSESDFRYISYILEIRYPTSFVQCHPSVTYHVPSHVVGAEVTRAGEIPVGGEHRERVPCDPDRYTVLARYVGRGEWIAALILAGRGR